MIMVHRPPLSRPARLTLRLFALTEKGGAAVVVVQNLVIPQLGKEEGEHLLLDRRHGVHR